MVHTPESCTTVQGSIVGMSGGSTPPRGALSPIKRIMNIKIDLNINAGESLVRCVNSIVQAFAKPLPKVEKTRIVLSAAPKVEEAPVAAVEEPAPVAEEPKAEAPATVSDADMRAAVARCRERIEGADWEAKTSDGYKLYHKKVTSAIKGIVGMCGADKIPSIPEDKRASFIQQVDELVVMDGEIMPNPPF